MTEHEIGRAKMFTSDRIEFVLEGDDDGRRCWRTYSAMTTVHGELNLTLDTVAFSPPDDWAELPLPGESRPESTEDEQATGRAEAS